MMNILLPTDFSGNSRNAAAYALQFFKDVPCTFYLLHVIPISTEKIGTAYVQTSSGIQENFNQLLDWMNSIKVNPQHNFNIIFKANYLIEAVREQVQEKNIDLILMGTKGVTNKKATVIGKNTSDVMMKVKCPVLAISENAVFQEHKEILFPTDYKISYSGKMLGILINLVSLSKSSLRILEIFNSEKEPSEEQKENRTFLQHSFFPQEPIFHSYYSSGNTSASKIFMANNNIDMIALAA
ncbi:MAG TPA: universal stress protein, partial [Salinimicrobium sp.]|nr:universal stress protein [Salinimicrobium sp.]